VRERSHGCSCFAHCVADASPIVYSIRWALGKNELFTPTGLPHTEAGRSSLHQQHTPKSALKLRSPIKAAFASPLPSSGSGGSKKKQKRVWNGTPFGARGGDRNGGSGTRVNNSGGGRAAMTPPSRQRHFARASDFFT
jgi:hypothetical protein